MAYQYLLYEKREGVAWITLNRPQVLNALNLEIRHELLAALADAEQDAAVRVVVLTGAGDKAFCAGADVAIFKTMTAVEAMEYLLLAKSVADHLEQLPKPVIAAVNGLALGGGCELLLACDVVVAVEEARFGQPEVNVGLIPGVGGTQRLPRLIGPRKAKELIFTGDFLDALEAQRLGLVNHVVPRAHLEAKVQELVEKLRSKSPLTLRFAKEAVNKAMELGLRQGLAYESQLFALAHASHDAKEGVAAFLEKRKPTFTGG